MNLKAIQLSFASFFFFSGITVHASLNGEILCATLGSFAYYVQAQRGGDPLITQHAPRGFPSRSPSPAYNPNVQLQGLDNAADPTFNPNQIDPSSDCRLTRGVEELISKVQGCFLVPLGLVSPNAPLLTLREAHGLIGSLRGTSPATVRSIELLLTALDRWEDCQHRRPSHPPRTSLPPMTSSDRARNRFNNWWDRLFGSTALPNHAMASGQTCSAQQVGRNAYTLAQQIREHHALLSWRLDRDRLRTQHLYETDSSREDLIQWSDASTALTWGAGAITFAAILFETRNLAAAEASATFVLRTGVTAGRALRMGAPALIAGAALASRTARATTSISGIPIGPTLRARLAQQHVRSVADTAMLVDDSAGTACVFTRSEFCTYWANADHELASTIPVAPSLRALSERAIAATRAAFCNR